MPENSSVQIQHLDDISVIRINKENANTKKHDRILKTISIFEFKIKASEKRWRSELSVNSRIKKKF
jgi:hypothetical protein